MHTHPHHKIQCSTKCKKRSLPRWRIFAVFFPLGALYAVLLFTIYNFASFPTKSILGLKTIARRPIPEPIKTYYIDCQNGSDGNKGNIPTAAWKTLRRVNRARFVSGDSIFLKRGCTWAEQLILDSSGTVAEPIIMSAYGTGGNPIIESQTSSAIIVKGSYYVIENIDVKVIATQIDSGCLANPIGEISGYSFESGASYNKLQNAVISGAYAGVYLRSGSHHNTITNNKFLNNNMMILNAGADNDHGAFSVLVWGDDNEISYNYMTGSDACSYDYTRDGSAVELYSGKRNVVKYNESYNNDAFVELGDSRTADNILAYNKVTSSLPRSIFLVTRGSGKFGPVLNTTVTNNTVYLTGERSQGFVCLACYDENLLTLTNNIIWSAWTVGRVEGSIVEENNIYWGGTMYFGMSQISKYTDPLFITPGSDFSLQSASPAIDTGRLNTVFDKDILGTLVPQGSATDIGAYEFKQ